MDTVSSRYQEFLDSVHYQGGKMGKDLAKSHVKTHTRKTKTGKTVLVKEYEDKRTDAHHVDPDFAAGMKARAMGKHHFESPHRHSSPRGLKWLEGWKHQKKNEEGGE